MRSSPARSTTLAILALSLAASHAAAQWVTTNGPAGTQTNAFAVSNGRLFAGTAGGGVLVAADNYTGWAPSSIGLTNGNVLSLAAGVNEFGARLLLAGTNGGGVFASQNDGANWGARNTGLTNGVVRAVAIIPDGYAGDRLLAFAGTDSGVYRSNSGGIGIQWRLVNTGLQNTLVRAFVHVFEGGDENDGLGAQDLFAATAGGGVFVSTDGLVWRAKNTGLGNLNVTSLAARENTGALFAGTTGGGVSRSTTWPFSGWTATGLTTGVIQAVTAAGNRIFAGTAGGGVLVSSNNGASWTAVNTRLPNLSVTALATDGTNLFAATAAGVFRRPLAQMP